MKVILTITFTICASLSAAAQGTFVYDQESSSDETHQTGGVAIQFYGSVGQSFTPSFSSVGFIRVKLFDVTPGNALGATLVMNLRSDAINGPIIGTAAPLALTNGFAGSANFLFSTAINVVQDQLYFFETTVQSGDTWGIRTMSNVPGDNYPGGMMFGGGCQPVLVTSGFGKALLCQNHRQFFCFSWSVV